MNCAAALPSHSVLDNRFRRSFRASLLHWFDRNRRDLPWRADHDPYRVWVSEIMLQQTRVAAVLGHYRQFLSQFPDVISLAGATESQVLAAWSGLGYYRRARFLHAAARRIVDEMGGEFPQDSRGWQNLPGIGRYTAAAIASICFGEAAAVVDGNVQRVLQRVLGLRNVDFWASATALLAPRRPGDFNQAFMELGALVCTPKDPLCRNCPVARLCASASLPPRFGGEPKPRRKVRGAFVLCCKGEKVLLVRRAEHETVMPGMWELPQLPEASERTAVPILFTVRHAIMNTDYTIDVVQQNDLSNRGGKTARMRRLFPITQLPDLPLTGLARKVLRRAHILTA